MMAIAEAMRNTAPAMKDRALPGPENYAQIPELAARGAARLTHFLDRFELHMADRDYVAGDFLSLADITACVALDFARVLKVDAYDDRVGGMAAAAQKPAGRSAHRAVISVSCGYSLNAGRCSSRSRQARSAGRPA